VHLWVACHNPGSRFSGQGSGQIGFVQQEQRVFQTNEHSIFSAPAFAAHCSPIVTARPIAAAAMTDTHLAHNRLLLCRPQCHRNPRLDQSVTRTPKGTSGGRASTIYFWALCSAASFLACLRIQLDISSLFRLPRRWVPSCWVDWMVGGVVGSVVFVVGVGSVLLLLHWRGYCRRQIIQRQACQRGLSSAC